MAFWTPEEDAIIQRDGPLGHSTTQMADAIGAELGIKRTRYMVLSRSRRLGVPLLCTEGRPARTWDDPERTAELARLWIKGDPVRSIAAQMSNTFGIKLSHNAVVGQVHRLGLAAQHPRPKGGKAGSAPKPKKVAPPPRPAKVVATPVFVDVSSARPWLTRKFGECAFPLGEQGDIHSCCAPTSETYCAGHRQVMGGKRLPWTSTKASDRRMAA